MGEVRWKEALQVSYYGLIKWIVSVIAPPSVPPADDRGGGHRQKSLCLRLAPEQKMSRQRDQKAQNKVTTPILMGIMYFVIRQWGW